MYPKSTKLKCVVFLLNSCFRGLVLDGSLGLLDRGGRVGLFGVRKRGGVLKMGLERLVVETVHYFNLL
jgi:hypothetical protein